MASIYLRHRTWWVKFQHPADKRTVRANLETHDPARANLLRRRLELEVALLAPRLQAADLPSGIREIVRDAGGEKAQVKAIEPAPSIVRAQAPAPGSGEKPRAAIEAALRAYLDFIRIENARHHVAGKLSMMRRFFGSRRVEIVTETPARAGKNSAAVHSPYFMGGFVDEITSVGVQSFMNQLGVSKKTKRHYREFFHHFFEFCMKFEFYRPTNWHSPNPIAALPSYVSRNRVIVFLTQEQVEQQLRLLADHPRLHMAVALMIYAGLRRAEMLWLSRDAISKDLSYLSIVNRIDNDRDIESSLKTGDRTVTILPPLKALLENYLPGLRGNWVIPSSKGKQWGGDSFSDKLRSLNKAAGLKWNCLHYRHTFATQRAFVGWPLFRIAKEMGNSVSVVEEYYAGFIRPIDNPSPAYKEPSPELLSASVSSSESSPASD